MLQAVADLLKEGKEDVVRRLIADASARSVGPFRDQSAAISFLRDRLASRLRPQMIWLFGSRTRGDAGPDSDVDLLVVLRDGLPAEAYRYDTVAAPVVAYGLGYDVVPCAWSDFLADREAPGSLVPHVVTEGRLFYQDPVLRRAGCAAACSSGWSWTPPNVHIKAGLDVPKKRPDQDIFAVLSVSRATVNRFWWR